MNLSKAKKDKEAPQQEERLPEQEKEPAQAQAAAGEEQQEAPADGQNGEPEKELTEDEVLKLYLEHTLGELKKKQGELQAAKKEAEESLSKAEQYKQKLAGVIAEYENYRRRTAAEKENIYADAVAKAVGALLPALDSLERAVLFAKANPESFQQGVEMTLKQLTDGFKSLGVTEIEDQGGHFSPELHNAVMHVEDETLGESVITEVFQKGYRIGDRVIRHSMVKVAN